MTTLRIYRYEHNREACTHPTYHTSGESLTGHGTMTTCATSEWDTLPHFGFSGSGPNRIMKHERCAVTADQFDFWRSATYLPSKKYRDWDLIAYEVEVEAEGIDWRIDNDQVVFNPEFATYVGTVTPADVRQARKVTV